MYRWINELQRCVHGKECSCYTAHSCAYWIYWLSSAFALGPKSLLSQYIPCGTRACVTTITYACMRQLTSQNNEKLKACTNTCISLIDWGRAITNQCMHGDTIDMQCHAQSMQSLLTAIYVLRKKVNWNNHIYIDTQMTQWPSKSHIQLACTCGLV